MARLWKDRFGAFQWSAVRLAGLALWKVTPERGPPTVKRSPLPKATRFSWSTETAASPVCSLQPPALPAKSAGRPTVRLSGLLSTTPLPTAAPSGRLPPTAPCGVARSTAHKNFNSFFHRCLPTYRAGLPTARSSPSLDILRASYGKSTWCLRREVLPNCSIEVPPIWPIPVGHLMANYWHLAKIPSTTRAHRFTSSISKQKTPPSSRALTASTRLAGHPTDGISPPSR